LLEVNLRDIDEVYWNPIPFKCSDRYGRRYDWVDTTKVSLSISWRCGFFLIGTVSPVFYFIYATYEIYPYIVISRHFLLHT